MKVVVALVALLIGATALIAFLADSADTQTNEVDRQRIDALETKVAELDDRVFVLEGYHNIQPTPTPTSEPTATPTSEPTATPTSEPTGGVDPLNGYANFMPYGVYERANGINSTTISDITAHNFDSWHTANGWPENADAQISAAAASGVSVIWQPTEQLKAWYDDAITPDKTLENAMAIICPIVQGVNGDIYPNLIGYNVDDEPFISEREEVWLAQDAFVQCQIDQGIANAVPAVPVMIANRIVDIYRQGDKVMLFDAYPVRATSAPGELKIQYGAGVWLDYVDFLRTVLPYKAGTDAAWLVMQAHQFDCVGCDSADLRLPSVEELRMQQWIATGEGVTGFYWFRLEDINGMIGLQGAPDNYAEAADLALRAQSIESIILNAYKVDDQFTMAGMDAGVLGYASSLKSRDNTTDYVVAVNRSVNAASLSVSSPTISGDLQDVETGEVFVQGEAISFRGGDGRMFKVVPPSGDPTPTATATATVTATATAQPSAYSLVYSDVETRDSPVALDGATVSGNVYVFTTPDTNVESVTFSLDGVEVWTEQNAPYDFAGGTSTIANPWDTTAVADGTHTISANMLLTDGSTVSVTATFTVNNSGVTEPTPTATVSEPTPTATTDPTPTATTTEPTTSGVPDVEANLSQNVDEWWAAHPLNPDVGVAIGAIQPPAGADEVILLSGANIQTAIDNAPPEGRVIYLSEGTYTHNIDIVGKSHIHIVGLHSNVVILGGYAPGAVTANNQTSNISACTEMKALNTFVQNLHKYTNRGDTSADPTAAYNCLMNPVKDLYFNNVTFDGNNTANHAFVMRGVEDVVFDNVEFQNFVDPGQYLLGLIHTNIYNANLWFRGVTMGGNQQVGILFDGVQGGGVVDSTFTGGMNRFSVGFFTNNDVSVDLNRNGTLEDSELRISRYGILDGNTINEWPEAFVAHAQHILVQNNTMTNSPRSFGYFETRVLSGNETELYDTNRYEHIDLQIKNNTLPGTSWYLVRVSMTSSCAGDPSCPIIGQYAVTNNTVTGSIGSGYPLVEETGTIVGPNTVCGNTVNGALYGTAC